VWKRIGSDFVPMEFEPVKSTRTLLSPAYSKEDEIIYKVNFMFDEFHEWPDLLRRLRTIWDALLAAGVELRFHWGKLHFADRAYIDQLWGKSVVDHFVRSTEPALQNNYFHELFAV
jgi:hypothetical protein